MKTVEKYVGLSLTRFMFDNANSYDFAIVKSRIRGYWCILAQGSLSSLNDRLGLILIDRQSLNVVKMNQITHGSLKSILIMKEV